MNSKEDCNVYKYEEKFKGSKLKLREFLRKIDLKLFANKFVIEGQRVIIPANEKLDFRVKYEIDDKYSLTIKVTWDGDLKKFEKKDDLDLLGG